ncbi:hypothetical protein QMK19_40615 [Streptomyces sp. H10-C2]|uniref:hypothetical protein n=1 Tax=unclassified Streptomyces TaxID=2593676 RepID=UPI0024B911B9|nr:MULTISPECIES: hypothetical protein [unclassified Streptomyces]MDJ0347498.1 hypothetical protein [Streptomyces sp. PH10-H1]MDJ0375709.1 hypothetical protein [Streptomyces sp. H10-C2]
MPTMLIDEPLGLTCVFSDGSRADFALDGLPNSHLARDLAIGLVDLIHPHGTADSAGTVNHYVQALRQMVRVLAERGFTGGGARLRRGQLAEFWLGSTGPREACTRAMVRAFAQVGGVLTDGVLELAEGRPYNQQPNHHQLPPYGEAEWQRLTEVCRTLADDSYAAHRQALAAAARAKHPGSSGWEPDNVRWLLARLGPVTAARFGEELGCSETAIWQRGGFMQASADLFPTHHDMIAYRLLFGIYSGIVPDGIDDLVTDDIDWAGDSTVLLSYVKGRTAAESLNLPRRAVRLLEQWLAHSALLRSFTGTEDRRRLWLALSRPGCFAVTTGTGGRVTIQRWVVRHQVLGGDGRPLKIHRSRIRTTHEAMRDKTTWTGSGRATIDPNHTSAVEGDHYLTAATPAQQGAIEAVIEDAQHDMLRRSHPPTVITEEDAATLAADYPQLVAAMDLDDTAIAELIGGQRDVFTAACGDQLSGLHGPKGKPCPARPWVCLLCPLAVFAPRHAANLLRLKAFFSRQWQQMPAAQFMAVFGPYAARIQQVLDRFDPAVLAAAAAHIADGDDELPLRPEEITA